MKIYENMEFSEILQKCIFMPLMQGLIFHGKWWNSSIFLKFSEIHQISLNSMEFGEFHGISPFWVGNALWPPRLRMLCFSNRNQSFPGPFHVKSLNFGDFTKFWWFWAISAHFTFSGEKSTFSHFSWILVHFGQPWWVLAGWQNHEAQTASTTNAGI